MAGFGEINKDKDGFEMYKRGQWINLTVGGQTAYYGKLSKIDASTGDVSFSKITRYVFNEMGCVFSISDEPMTFQLKTITSHRRTTEEEARQVIENQSIFYKHFGKLVAIPCSGTTYIGNVHKIYREYIELLPYLNFSCDEAYIEKDTPLSLSANSNIISQVIPKKEGELEHRLKEILEAKKAAKPQVPAQQERKAETTGLGT